MAARETGRIDLDQIDRGIVALLQQNGRMANLEIARQLGVAEATVRKRMERLLDEGIIRVRAVVSPTAVGYPIRILVGIRAELSRLQEVARQAAAIPQVRSVSLTTGSYDLVLEAALPSSGSLEPFLIGKVAAIPGVLHSETFQVLRTIKEAADWRVPEGEMEIEKAAVAKKVLVVDDDPSFRTICRAVLSKGGYNVITAVDGSDGLNKARQDRPDIIILDYMMATPTEGSLVSWLLKGDPQLRKIPLLMVTAVGTTLPWWKEFSDKDQLPIEAWLDKPVTPERLLAEVERLLRTPSQAT